MKESKKYFDEIKELIPSKNKRTKDFLKNFKSQIEEYETDNIDCTYNDLIQEFGFPEDVIASYFGESQINELIKNLTIKRYLKLITIVIITVVVLLGSWKAYLIYTDYKISTSQIPTHIEISEPEEIESERID